MNQNILILNDVNTGNNLKQGDQTILKYLCGDGSGDVLKLEGLKARAVLKNRKNTVVYSTDTTVNSNHEVMFVIDKILPPEKYILEIIVDDRYIFPSDNSLYINITPSSLGSLFDDVKNNYLDDVKDYIEETIDSIDKSFTQSEADELYQPKGDYAERSELNSYAKSEELKNFARQSDLTPYATKAYVDSLDVSDQLTDYATTEYVKANFAERTDLEGLATNDYVDNKVTGLATTEYVDSLDISDQLTNYATKADLENIQLTDEQKAELKGEPFRYEDFTEEQLQALKGKDGVDGKDGINGVDGKDGKPFTYDDFTEEQLESLKGADGADGKSIEVWKGTGNEYLALESTDPNTLYLIKEG